MAGSPEITPRALAEAAKLVGIPLRDEDLAGVAEHFKLITAFYEQARALELPNELSPALRFDPLLPGAELPTQPAMARSDDDPGPLPDSDEDIAFAPVTQLSRWLEHGALSSLRLTEIYLERIARFAAQLECVITVTEERARAEARRADAELAAGNSRGPLHGIPWGAKDLLDTAGIPTTWGTGPYRDRVAKGDAEVVRRLSDAGAVLIAKLTLGEIAMGDVWFGGMTRNPWKPEEGSGGSSAGSAAATAAGLVGFAIGTETLGSITNPCMTCGTTGLRPTHGRVPRTGAMALCWSLDKIGPITRTAEDAALVLAAINGGHPGDLDSRDVAFGFDAKAGVQGARVGYVPHHFAAEWSDRTDGAERQALDALVRRGAELVEIELPELPYASIFSLIWVEAAAAFQELVLQDRLGELAYQGPNAWPNSFRAAHLISAVEYVQLQRVRHRIMREMQQLFADVDAIAAPGMGHTFSLITNATGHPSLTQRVGFREDGTPFALTLHGQLYDEGRLCQLGRALEAELGLWQLRPPRFSNQAQ
jgi:Asp-tRNA(Asn)/Glu-tRNA(Gln) amidotransferase A subunit family amidase